MGWLGARGRAGEHMAAAYLELRGCTVRRRNARLAGVEVDLVVDDGDTAVVVEVKVRGGASFGGASQALAARQRRRLVRAAGALLHGGAAEVRIDLVAIDLEADGAMLRHYRNAVTGN